MFKIGEFFNSFFGGIFNDKVLSGRFWISIIILVIMVFLIWLFSENTNSFDRWLKTSLISFVLIFMILWIHDNALQRRIEKKINSEKMDDLIKSISEKKISNKDVLLNVDNAQ